MQNAVWIIMTAGGHGARFGQSLPKQYTEIANQSVLGHSIACFNALPRVQAIILPIPSGDPHIHQQSLETPFPLITVTGGKTRYLSVANALNAIREQAEPDDWVLVHDGVRPCLHPHDLEKLFASLQSDSVGGILATPVKDTLKHVREDGRITQTVPREHLWHALTPQMFRFAILDKAIAHVIEHDIEVTDDASAIECLGMTPKIVEAEYPNPKLTTPQDLPFIEQLLKRKQPCSV